MSAIILFYSHFESSAVPYEARPTRTPMKWTCDFCFFVAKWSEYLRIMWLNPSRDRCVWVYWSRIWKLNLSYSNCESSVQQGVRPTRKFGHIVYGECIEPRRQKCWENTETVANHLNANQLWTNCRHRYMDNWQIKKWSFKTLLLSIPWENKCYHFFCLGSPRFETYRILANLQNWICYCII